MDGSNKLMLSNSIGKYNISKHFVYTKSNCHIRVLGVSSFAYTCYITTSDDGGADVDGTAFYHGGWFIVNIESESYLSAIVSKFAFYYKAKDQFTSYQRSVKHEIELSTKCFPFPVQIDFKGKLGNEFIVLNGLRKKSAKNIDIEKYKNKYGINLPLKSNPVISIEAETNYQTEDYFNLLGELINTEKTPEIILETDQDYDYNYCVPVEVNEDEILTNSDEKPINAGVKITYYPYQ